MEYCEIPYKHEELKSENYQDNFHFLEKLEKEVLGGAVFDHPFLKKIASGIYTQEGVKYALSQFGNIIMPFTAAICKLMGNAPDLKARFMLMDNLYEELGNMKYNQCHPSLYLSMLSSIGVNQKAFEDLPTLPSIRILNNAILDAVEHKSFAIGCAWLGYGGELTIPNNFPYLVKGLKKVSFENIDMTYWDRHGPRDQEHSDDATMVLCMNTSPKEHDQIKEAVIDSLALRAAVWSELEEVCDLKYKHISVITGKETDILPKEYKALSKYYKALNSANIKKMQKVWIKDDTASFTSPLGGLIKGYDEVIQAHEDLFLSPIEIDVEYYDVEMTHLDNGFCAVGKERGTMTIEGKVIEVGFRTSRVFIQEEGILKQLHHHGSFENMHTQEKIMELLATI